MEKHVRQYIWYDYSAEIVVGNIFAQEGGLIAKDCFYSIGVLYKWIILHLLFFYSL